MKIVLNQGTRQTLVLFGVYELSRIDDEKLWIGSEGGEGMECYSKDIEALIDKYYRDNF